MYEYVGHGSYHAMQAHIHIPFRSLLVRAGASCKRLGGQGRAGPVGLRAASGHKWLRTQRLACLPCMRSAPRHLS